MALAAGVVAIAVTLAFLVAAPAVPAQVTNLTRIREIAGGHTYTNRECMEATEHLWGDLTAAGFSVRIMAGNLTSGSTRLADVNHVWISAEDEPGHWVSIEPILGAVMSRSLDIYYRPAAVVETPEEMRDVYNRGRPAHLADKAMKAKRGEEMNIMEVKS
jgi:hypothetical protein